MKEKTRRITYRPTKAIFDAIQKATLDYKLAHESENSGVWLIADTIRYLITIPYKPNKYKYSNNRMTAKGVNVSDLEYKRLIENSPLFDREPNTVHILRALVSALVQEGYLSESQLSENGDEPPTPITFLSESGLRLNKRQPRRSNADISA